MKFATRDFTERKEIGLDKISITGGIPFLPSPLYQSFSVQLNFNKALKPYARTDRLTDGQTYLNRCEDTSKSFIKELKHLT